MQHSLTDQQTALFSSQLGSTTEISAEKQQELWELSAWMEQCDPSKSKETHYQNMTMIETIKIQTGEPDPPQSESKEDRNKRDFHFAQRMVKFFPDKTAEDYSKTMSTAHEAHEKKTEYEKQVVESRSHPGTRSSHYYMTFEETVRKIEELEKGDAPLDRELFRHLICTIVGFLFRSLLFL
jgi:hypothetical protein